MVRSGVALLLENMPGFEVCAEAGTVGEALDAAERHAPDLIVLDLFLGGRDGEALIAELRRRRPAARLLVYSGQEERLYAKRSLAAGADGYVMKATEFSRLREAILTVAAGRRYLSEAMREVLVEEALRPAGAGATGDELAGLSERELNVLRLIAAGRELGEMARELDLSVKTIGTYRERLKSKLGVETARLLERKARELLGAEKGAA